MVDVVFHVDDRHVRPLGKLLDDPQALVVFPVDLVAQDADGDAVAHAREHAGDIGDALRAVALVFAFQGGQAGGVGLQEVRVTAQLEDAGLEAVARAQRGVEEHHEQRAPRQDVIVAPAHGVVGLELQATSSMVSISSLVKSRSVMKSRP